MTGTLPSIDFSRDVQVDRLTAEMRFDVLIVGGGATGAGIAVDAASRGYRVALCEQSDFGKGTSSRSTKLVHGGVRYLEQGDLRLVRDALYERGLLLRNAPHLVYRLPTILPLYRWWEPFYYRAGLLAYDLLAGRQGFGRSMPLSRSETLAAIPTLKSQGLRGGIRYYDGGFDDARLLINLVQTAVLHGAVCVNYARVSGLVRESGKVVGAEVTDLESGTSHTIRAKVVVNAAGAYGDTVRRMAQPHAESWIQPSQGVHLVLGREFLPGDSALIIPRTSDNRVVFAIPWHGRTLVGTTDTPLTQTPLDPIPLKQEIDFLIETIGGCLTKRPMASDIFSVFAGLRPLVRKTGSEKTSRLGRDHSVRVDDTGLVTVLGGKWTTYRKMAQDCVERCIEVADLPPKPCRTATLPLRSGGEIDEPLGMKAYGSDAKLVRELLDSDSRYQQRIDPDLPCTVGEVIWAVRYEMARTVEDVLSRRQRALLLNAKAALRAAPNVAKIIAEELGHDDTNWITTEVERFQAIAQGYTVEGAIGG